jgi:hypothetical protein
MNKKFKNISFIYNWNLLKKQKQLKTKNKLNGFKMFKNI